MTHTISFINLKGGVGKTTTTVATAEFLAVEHDKRVLVVDLDPQTNATTALISETRWQQLDQQGRTIAQLFADKLNHTQKFDIQQSIVHGVSNLSGGLGNLSLLPSSLALIELQDQLALIPGGNYFSISPVDVLATALRPVHHDYDYVLIDCPPNMGIITLNGINISGGYVIPTIPDILSTYGIPQITNRISAFSQAKGISVEPVGIVVSKFRTQSSLHSTVYNQMRGAAAAGTGPHVFDTYIPESNHIAEAPNFAAPVNTLRQKYGYGNNYERYSALTQEFIDRVNAL